MDTISDDSIRTAAYYLWEQQGRPEGLDFEHWVKAKEMAAKTVKKAPKKAAAKKAKKTAAKKATTKKPATKKK